MRREYSAKLERSQEDRIINLVKRLVDLLEENPDHSDEQRITRRYSRFVQHILDAHLAELHRRREKPKCESASASNPSDSAVKTIVTEEAASLCADMQPPTQEPLAQCLPNVWDELFPNQPFGPTSPLMGMTDMDYMSLLSLPEDDPFWTNDFSGRF